MSAASTPPLKQLFTAHFDFTPTQSIANNIIRWRTLFETRDSHAEALNTPLLGVFKMKFLPRDSDALFDILSIDRTEFSSIIKQSSVNTDFIVASDPFNILTVWAAHKFFNANLPKTVRENAMESLLFMLLVKFFASFVGHVFPYGAKRDVMEATIDSLSDKFDIKRPATGTWKLIMLARTHELVSTSNNIHLNAIKTFSTDDRVTYMITDTQTRIRTKIKNIMVEYYKMEKSGKTIGDSSLVETDKEGDKSVKALQNTFDAMTTSVCNRVLNINQFIRTDYMKIAASKTSNVRIDMLRQLLLKFSTLATFQYRQHKEEEIDKLGNYVGYAILIRNLIQRTYRACIMDKVKMTSRLAILDKASDLYRSSRVSDPEILKIKASFDSMVEKAKLSSRPATNVSLKIALIIYLILLTFDMD